MMDNMMDNMTDVYDTRYLSPVWSHLTSAVITKGEGIYLYDKDGNKYIDFTCGIAVTNTGHCHPKIVTAIKEQAEQLIFGQINCVVNHRAIELSHILKTVMPHGIDRFFFSNSGAEAVEGAVKLAKAATGKTNIIAFEGGFHGRTAMTMALTGSKTIYRSGFQPLPSGVFFAPFPYAYYYKWDEETTVDFCINELKRILKSLTSPRETAAVIIEPILGEGGYVPAPDRYLRELRNICDENGILLILDEIQSGFGRVGEWLAHTVSGVKADIVTMAKGMASGMPVSCVASGGELMSRWETGSHGGTYGGGNAVALAAAVATITVMKEEKLIENAREMGAHLLQGLRGLQGKYPIIGDVRGRGLMIGVELQKDGEPAPGETADIIAGCLDRKLLLLSCGTFGSVIRWIPPLIVTKSQVDHALSIFEDVLHAKALSENAG